MSVSGENIRFADTIYRQLKTGMAGEGTAASAAIIRDGKLIAAAACGTRGDRGETAVTTGDLFCVGSVSKVYCALAVLKLTELGLATLDTPVCQYLPRFTMKDERYRRITLRMCLNHSSGLPGTFAKMGIAAGWHFSDYYGLILDYLSKSALKAEPGTVSTYCNDGFALAEMVVAQRSGTSFAEFLWEHITRPLDAASTCVGDAVSPRNNTQGREWVKARGQPREFIQAIGSGGINTDLTDCAKMGSLFLDPCGIVSRESLAQIVMPQKLSGIPGDPVVNFGLGWDSVSFRLDGYDFGPGVLMKSGGTAQFSSYLLVSPRHGFSAAISVTHDTGISPLELLCDFCAELQEQEGLTVRVPLPRAQTNETPPTAAACGTYLGYAACYRVSNRNDAWLEQFEPDGWQPVLSGYYGGGSFYIRETGVKSYLMQHSAMGARVWGQKVDARSHGPMPEAWNHRLGKKYIVCDTHPDDFGVSAGEGGGVTLYALPETDILLFCRSTSRGYQCMPATAKDDDTTDYGVNMPGSPGSRDVFAPYIEMRDGVETLYHRGYTLMDAEAAPLLATGQVTSPRAMENRIYRTTAGQRLSASKPDSVRTVLLRQDLSVYYDGLFDSQMPPLLDGYALFLNAEPMEFTIEVEG